MRQFSRLVPVSVLFLAAAASVTAQQKSPLISPARPQQLRETPPGIRNALPRPSTYALGALNLNEQHVLATAGRLPRIGVHRGISSLMSATGTWQQMADGSSLWRLALESKGAAGIRVQFGNFSIGNGKLWVYGSDGHAQGPYTAAGVFGNGEFWTGTVWGETAVIEYQPATAADRSLPFQIRSIAHRASPRPGFSARRNASPALLADSQPWVDPAAGCNIDVSCYSDWADAAKTVSEINFETVEDGVQYEAACSASLVGTRDNSLKPYLLTAGHCINNEVAARTVETFWDYQTTQCDGTPPVLKSSPTSSVGADYLASGSLAEGDYSLLLLKDVPGGVLYAGWDTNDVPIGTNVVSIHHPMASFKRILFGHRSDDALVVLNGYNLPSGEYYVVTTDLGIAQPGSSGSPLFSAPGVVIGTTTYGPALDGADLCALGSFDVGYGRFSVAYPNLSSWLEDMPYSQVIPSPANVLFSGDNGVISGGPQSTVLLTTEATNPVTFSARSDATWMQVSSPTTTTSASNPAPLTITVNPKLLMQPGSYAGTVTILSGAAPPQFINVSVQMKLEVSNVVGSTNPAKVNQGSNGLWSYTIVLQETAGVSTQVNLLRIDGRDYSNNIPTWFGSNMMAANGALQAPLKAKVLVAPATQTIEVGGLDPASQQNWYRVITVSLLP